MDFRSSCGVVTAARDVHADSSTRLKALLQAGFAWAAAAKDLGITERGLRYWWERKGSLLADPVELALSSRLIQANYQFSPPQLFDGLMVCRCGRRMERPAQARANGRPQRWSCPICRLPSGKRDWVESDAVKMGVFEALQTRLPEMARLCMYRTPMQRERERQWLQQLEDFLALSRRLHESGLPRMDYPTMAARVQLARDQGGEPLDLERNNWAATFSEWKAWKGASSHQWRMVSVYFSRKVTWDGQQIRVQLFGRRLVDPLLMDGNKHLVDQPLRLFPVNPLPFSHPAHRFGG
jgi:hypothetical protein